MTDVKLSEISDGSTFVPATDQIVTVRSGGTDVLTTLGTMSVQAASNVAITGGSATINNTGFKIKDTDASNTLAIVPGSDLTGNRTFTITTGDADRTLTMAGAATISGTNTGDISLVNTKPVAFLSLSGQALTCSTVDVSADVTGIMGSANGGTANGFTKFSGPLTSEKTFTLPNASCTVLTTNAAVTPAQGGTGVANNAASTITITGSFPTTVTISGTTAVTLPTSGTLATLAGSELLTTKTINGSNNTITNISLTTAVTGILPVANGGTNNAFFTISGPASSAKTYTVPNASCTLLTTNDTVTVGQGGTGGTTWTSNALLKGNTTSALVASGVTLGSNNEIAGYQGSINANTSTAYTLVSTDTGKIVELNNASAITLTAPNSLGTGFCCTLTQMGAGQVSISAASGATVRQRSSYTKIAGQYGVMTMYVTSNTTGTNATYVLAGDGST